MYENYHHLIVLFVGILIGAFFGVFIMGMFNYSDYGDRDVSNDKDS